MAKKRKSLVQIIKDFLEEQRRDAELRSKFKRSVQGGHKRKRLTFREYIRYQLTFWQETDEAKKKLQRKAKAIRRSRKSKNLFESIKEAREENKTKAQMKRKFRKSVTGPKRKIPLKERIQIFKQDIRNGYHNFFFGEINGFSIINSTIIFVTTYLMVFFANDLAIALAAKYFELKPILYYHSIVYANYSGWYPHAVKRIFITGPFLTAGIGIGAYVIYLMVKNKNVFIRLFFIWTSLLGFANFLAKLISIPNYKGRLEPTSEMSLGIVTGYLYYSTGFENILSVIGFLLTIPMGLLMAKPFVQTAWSSQVIRSKTDKARLIFQVGVIPFLIGTVIIFFINYPGNFRANFINTIAIGFGLIWAFMGARAFFEILIHRQKIYEKGRVSIAALAILFCIIFFYRFILGQGLEL